MFVCVYCGGGVTSDTIKWDPDDPQRKHRCPHCNKFSLVRGKTKLGSTVYFQQMVGGICDTSIDAGSWTPQELEAIASDLRQQQREGKLLYEDGSGSRLAGRMEDPCDEETGGTDSSAD